MDRGAEPRGPEPGIATYAQWARAFSAKPVPRRLTWVCGPEMVLASEVTQALVTASGAQVVRNFRAGDDPEDEIVSACRTYPDESRMVVVRDAHKVRSWDFIPDAADACAAGAWAVFVSADADFSPRPEQGQKRDPYPGVAAVRSAGGQAVRCVLSAQEDRISWAQAQAPGISPTAAWEILARSGQHLGRVHSACVKIRAAGLPPGSMKWLEFAVDDHEGGDFADLLVLGRRQEAMAAIEVMDPDGFGKAAGQLASRLDLLATLHGASQAGMSAADIRTRLHVDQYLIARFRKASYSYAPDRVRRLRELLGMLDSAFRSGAREGVAEALAALW